MNATVLRCGAHGEPLGLDDLQRLLCPVEGLDCTTWGDTAADPGERLTVLDGVPVVVSEH